MGYSALSLTRGVRAIALAAVLALIAIYAVTPVHAGDQRRPGERGEREPIGCWDNVNRYVDCHNGTYADTESGLVWLKDPSCFDLVDYATANWKAAKLRSGECGLTDDSEAGDWRLPTLTEFKSLFTDSCVFPKTNPLVGVSCNIYGDPLWAHYPLKYASRINTNPVGFWTSATTPPFYPGSSDYSKDCGSVNGDLPVNNTAVCAFEFVFGFQIPLLKTDTGDASIWPVRRVP